MLKSSLAGVLSDSELKLVTSSFDVIGSIAILKIPDELSAKEQTIADALLERVTNVRTVLKQVSDVKGEFRRRELKLVAGEDTFVTVYRESGCFFKVNVSEVYFSPRLATERERIARLAADGEHVFNMFAGIGTFSLIIAKSKRCVIESVDKNPAAIELAFESLRMNKRLLGKVNPIFADAKDYALKKELTFDRVLMPLPERADEFLPFALKSCKKNAAIHYYVHLSGVDFRRPSWLTDHLHEIIPTGTQFKVLNWKRVREVGPRYIQAVADLQIEKVV